MRSREKGKEECRQFGREARNEGGGGFALGVDCTISCSLQKGKGLSEEKRMGVPDSWGGGETMRAGGAGKDERILRKKKRSGRSLFWKGR